MRIYGRAKKKSNRRIFNLKLTYILLENVIFGNPDVGWKLKNKIIIAQIYGGYIIQIWRET